MIKPQLLLIYREAGDLVGGAQPLPLACDLISKRLLSRVMAQRWCTGLFLSVWTCEYKVRLSCAALFLRCCYPCEFCAHTSLLRPDTQAHTSYCLLDSLESRHTAQQQRQWHRILQGNNSFPCCLLIRCAAAAPPPLTVCQVMTEWRHSNFNQVISRAHCCLPTQSAAPPLHPFLPLQSSCRPPFTSHTGEARSCISFRSPRQSGYANRPTVTTRGTMNAAVGFLGAR